MKILYVGMGGFIGAVLRYSLSLTFATLNSPFPIITLLINFVGSFLIGLIISISGQVSPINANLLLFLTVGLCGGFTTFSTFSLETFRLIDSGKMGLGIFYATLSVIICLFGVIAARILVSKFFA